MRGIGTPLLVLLLAAACAGCGQQERHLSADARAPHLTAEPRAPQPTVEPRAPHLAAARRAPRPTAAPRAPHPTAAPRAPHSASLSLDHPRDLLALVHHVPVLVRVSRRLRHDTVGPHHQRRLVTRPDQHLVRQLQRGVMVPRNPALAPPPRILGAAARVISTRIRGQSVLILLPHHPNHRAVLFEHGADETADLDVDGPPASPTIAALLRAGYAWAESDAAFNNWGNATSLADDVALADWLRRHGDSTIDLGGDSMGGLDVTQLIPLVHPEAVFELFPVCDLRSVWDLFGDDIRLAHTRVARLSPVRMYDVRGLAMLITASPQDTVVSKATNADVCYHEAQAAGAHVTEVTTVGQHDNPSNWRAGRLIAFLELAADQQRRDV
jgi:hypothetical protein